MEKRRHHSHHRRSRNRSLRIALIILCAIVFVTLVAGASAWFLWKRSKVFNAEEMFVPTQKIDIGEPAATPAPTPTQEERSDKSAPPEYDIAYGGKYYRLRSSVVSVLFMGIDSKNNEATDSEIVSGTDQADVLLLGVFDTESGATRVLQIPRDTEADVKVLDMTKTYVDTERMHICLQHAYGDGGALSCQLMTDAVSNLLFGVPVNRYVSLGYNGVVKAVNAIGGLELTMLEDFTNYSSVMKKGATVKLNGKRALTYIRGRMSMKEESAQTDGNRRERQVQFLEAYIARVKVLAKENPTVILTVYEAVKDYLQTDLTLEELLFLANQGLESGFSKENLITLPGTVGSEEQPLFHMDDEAARAIALDLFYEEVAN